MDILAHALWAGAGGRLLERRGFVGSKTLWWMVALAVAPDIVPMLPVAGYALVNPRSLQFVIAYITATPGTEPALPPAVSEWTHHLHCTMHSVVVLSLLTALLWFMLRRFPIVLLGWWSHVLLDIPTHSADYYGVPLLYPISDRAFDGIAWTEPWLLAVNYTALVLVYLWLYRRSDRREQNSSPDADRKSPRDGGPGNAP
jgi:hypothetical protein